MDLIFERELKSFPRYGKLQAGEIVEILLTTEQQNKKKLYPTLGENTEITCKKQDRYNAIRKFKIARIYLKKPL